ncbi:unnamed protein product [Periconia digitata]|uniref:Uncharacterized protein n=1 Tax=Periconia digitata TaxID=1303443 RepID=A0A9W4XH23_9PLEO|nr:unnamed protein product [Periconia digitata]
MGISRHGTISHKAIEFIAMKKRYFSTETPFADPTHPETSLLFAQFVDEDAIIRWRNNSTHLGIMHHSRHHMFNQFRVIVGTDASNPSSELEGGRVVVVYQRLPLQDCQPEHMQLSYVTKSDTSALVTESEFFVGENSWVWIAKLTDGSSAEEYEESLQRVSGDILDRVHVVREYTKTERSEAPGNLDAAEARGKPTA